MKIDEKIMFQTSQCFGQVKSMYMIFLSLEYEIPKRLDCPDILGRFLS